MRKIVVIADNLRSAHNVGSLLRTAEGLGVAHVYLTGYTPHPPTASDSRLPHEKTRALSQIQKTSLGAEKSLSWSYQADVSRVLQTLKNDGYFIAALEQTDESLNLSQFTPTEKIGLVVGNEIDGVTPVVLKLCDVALEIPMKGTKESFNVTVAAAIAIYHFSYS